MPNDKTHPEDFNLESPPEPGKVSAGVIEELRKLRNGANEAATDFREAITLQAEKHKVKAAALRRYVIALASDKVDGLEAEVLDIEKLIG
jgi:hypothetical protein